MRRRSFWSLICVKAFTGDLAVLYQRLSCRKRTIVRSNHYKPSGAAHTGCCNPHSSDRHKFLVVGEVEVTLFQRTKDLHEGAGENGSLSGKANYPTFPHLCSL